jgi:flagellar capping protein FliD
VNQAIKYAVLAGFSAMTVFGSLSLPATAVEPSISKQIETAINKQTAPQDDAYDLERARQQLLEELDAMFAKMRQQMLTQMESELDQMQQEMVRVVNQRFRELQDERLNR